MTNQTTDAKMVLLPCPFCGSLPDRFVNTEHHTKQRLVLGCMNEACPVSAEVSELQYCEKADINWMPLELAWSTRCTTT